MIGRGAIFVTTIVIMVATVIGCGNNGVPRARVMSVDLPTRTFDSTAYAVFELDSIDTTTFCDFDIFFRTIDNQPIGNFTVLVKVELPSGHQYTDTVSTMGIKPPVGVHIQNHEIPYRHSIKWANSGKHIVSIRPLSTIRGIISVGISINYTQSKN